MADLEISRGADNTDHHLKQLTEISRGGDICEHLSLKINFYQPAQLHGEGGATLGEGDNKDVILSHLQNWSHHDRKVLENHLELSDVRQHWHKCPRESNPVLTSLGKIQFSVR